MWVHSPPWPFSLESIDMSYLPALWRTGSYTPPSGITRTTTAGTGQLFFLPRPVMSLPVELTWKGQLESPKVKHGGNAVRGNYLASTIVPITGKFQQYRVGSSDTTLVNESDVWELWYDLVDFLNPTETTTQFELFWWYDSAGSKYRKWKNVEKASFSKDGGDNSYNPPVFGYTLQFHIVNPVIYTTAPGA